mmetsp:Transcript_30796/g.73346  ORF Transcript_30796/g.73346 Transcript_30796/m.73346 type:complete len:119 (-) Transcript_30796:699-1055(-)
MGGPLRRNSGQNGRKALRPETGRGSCRDRGGGRGCPAGPLSLSPGGKRQRLYAIYKQFSRHSPAVACVPCPRGRHPKYMSSVNRVGLKPVMRAKGIMKKMTPTGQRNTSVCSRNGRAL